MAEPRIAPRIAEPPPAAPQALERADSRGAEPAEPRLSDQRYDGYADPNAPDPNAGQARRSEQAWRDPDPSDPYYTEAGWRAPRKRAAAGPESTAAQFQNLAVSRESGAAAQGRAAERARISRPATPTSPVQPAGRRSAAAQAVAPAVEPLAESRAATNLAALDELREAYERYAPSADGTYEAGDYYDDRQPVAQQQSERGDDVYGGEDGYDYDDLADEEQIQGGGRRKVWLALALVGLAVLGTGGAYAVRSHFAASSQSGPPPIIQADTSPKKIAAVHPGDKQLQERLGDRSETERMVPREEQPLTIKDPNAPPVVSAPATTSAATAHGGTPEASEPRRIRTVTIRPNGEPAEDTPAIPAATPAQAVPPAQPAVATPQAVPVPPPAPRARTATAEPPPSAASSRVKAGDYMVQLSAQKSEADAKASFRLLRSKYASVLGSQELYIKRKDLGSRGVYYGAQVGPFPSRSAAAQLCDSLKAAGGTCIVQRN